MGLVTDLWKKVGHPNTIATPKPKTDLGSGSAPKVPYSVIPRTPSENGGKTEDSKSGRESGTEGEGESTKPREREIVRCRVG